MFDLHELIASYLGVEHKKPDQSIASYMLDATRDLLLGELNRWRVNPLLSDEAAYELLTDPEDENNILIGFNQDMSMIRVRVEELDSAEIERLKDIRIKAMMEDVPNG